MDRIRTLLLARTHVVVMDPDLVASASTRPSREADAEALEDDLAQLGPVEVEALANGPGRGQQLVDVHGRTVRRPLRRRSGPRRAAC